MVEDAASHQARLQPPAGVRSHGQAVSKISDVYDTVCNRPDDNTRKLVWAGTMLFEGQNHAQMLRVVHDAHR